VYRFPSDRLRFALGPTFMNVELVVDCQAIIGESPTWSAPDQTLFWVDVKAPALYRRDAHGATREWPLPSDVGAFALLRQGTGAVVALRGGVYRLDFASAEVTRLVNAPFDGNLFRFNEGICDSQGRFWVGVMFDPLPAFRAEHRRTGVLHRFTFAEGLIAFPDESELHNGFAWGPNDSTFYLAHSRSHRVYRAPYDLTTGTMGRARSFAEVGSGKDVPDGAAVDEEGCYWCAVHGAGALHRYDPAGHLVSRIALPVSQPTMCAFVGPTLDELVVTSARQNLTEEQLAREPHAGGVFRLRPGVRGLGRPCVVQ
jgi:sugar lactone lactonase YvrE